MPAPKPFRRPAPGTNRPKDGSPSRWSGWKCREDASLKATDFFSPYDNALLDETDLDLGSAAPIALPSAYFGTEKAPDLLVQASKEGNMYLLNRDELGGVAKAEGKDAVVQTLEGYGGVWDGAAVWPGDGGYVYIPSVSPGGSNGGSSGNLRFFKYGVEAGDTHPVPRGDEP